MADSRSRPTQHVDKDGVRTTQGSGVRLSVWLLALAMGLVGLAVFVVIRPALRQSPAAPPASNLAADAPAPHATWALRKSSPPGRPAAAPAVRFPRAAAAPVQERAAERPTPALDADTAPPDADAKGADQPTGLAVFPPPGTKPIKRGIIVPEGVALPPGYVRHYQTTDDGQQLPAILMFHPDYHPLDENGDPIPLPTDRIVPPEMAPPGIPIQMLDVPEEGAPVTRAPGRGRGAPER